MPTTSCLFSVVVDVMSLHSAKQRDVSIASHGRHPNFSLLMGGPRNRIDRALSGPSAHHETLSIAERPYLYWFTGRKWPSSLHQKALCEAASCEITAPPPCPSSSSLNIPAAFASLCLRCTRYEIVGSPVVLERFQFRNSENSLCRMFCSKQLAQEARAGCAVAHLEGANVASVRELFMNETTPTLLPEHGHREASWCTFNSAIDDERSSESSCSGAAASVHTTAVEKNGRASSDLDMLDGRSLGRSSTSSYGMSTSATPLTPPSTRGESVTPSTAGHSPEPVLLAPPVPQPLAAPPQCHYKSATTRSFHLSTVADIIARDELLYCHRFTKDHQTAAATTSYQSNTLAVVRGWTFWRNSKCADLATLERRSVVSSMHEIMMSNSCSRTAYHLAVCLLDRYIAVSATVLSSSSCAPPNIDAPSSSAIRIAIACAIAVAAKAVDIYAPSLERLGMSLGAGVFSGDVPFEKRELNFLNVLRFYVHPLTVEEASDSLLELWFGCTTQVHPSIGAPTPAMDTSSKRAATMTRYMVDLIVRSATHTSIPPTYMAAAVVKYCVEAVRVADKRSENDMAPLDEEGLHEFMAHLSDQELANQCIELLRRHHSAARMRPVDFLESHYDARSSTRSCRTACLVPFSLLSVPPLLPAGVSETAYHK
jgi:hypothetical protein